MPASPERVKRFVRNLTTTTGKWAGRPFDLHPFQEQWIDLVFQKGDDGHRVKREILLGVGRKNGKTELTAAMALALLILDGERGGLVVGAAAKRDQARLMLDTAKRMVWQSSIGGVPLAKYLQVRRDSIYFPELDATYKVIAADAQREHGLNPHAVIVDEAHATMEKSRELYDTLLTAQGAREDPIAISITTAGPVPAGPLYELYRYGKEVQDGRRNDPGFGMLWYEALPGAAVDDPQAWRDANPALGLFLREKFLEDASAAVLSGKSPEFMFRRLHLNQWTTAAERWLPYEKVQACGEAPEIPDGAEVWIAIDAAIRRDTFAVALVYVAEEFQEDPATGEQVRRQVAHAKVKRFTPDHEAGYIDPMEVMTYVLGLCERYSPARISYDPAYMQIVAQLLAERGLPVEPFPQSAMRMERATETFQRVILDGRMRHGGDPVLLEQIASIATKPTERGVRISKAKTQMPVDMAVALSMALDDAMGGDELEVDDFAMFV
ncbi:terminase large subunit [Kitasatospora kazusensis]|uniref:Terminase large subunit n=1 Tax=Kitasatospora kazusensis TaxID=407974 RepID=A0ABP5L8A4_9ACTN